MSFVKDFSGFFRTRSDSNLGEVRAYLSGLMQARRGAKNLERMEEDVPDFNYQTRGWLAWHHHMALVMLALLFLAQERMHSPQPATPEGPVSITGGDITGGDITFILERLLPRRGHGPADEEALRGMVEQRIRKRMKDQVRRRIKTRATRPPLLPDEIPPR